MLSSLSITNKIKSFRPTFQKMWLERGNIGVDANDLLELSVNLSSEELTKPGASIDEAKRQILVR